MDFCQCTATCKISKKHYKKAGKMYLNKWSNIRDNWVRSYKQFKRNERSGSGANKFKIYIYHEQLRFLEKVVDKRPTISSLSKENDISEEENGRSIIDKFCDAIENENTAEETVSIKFNSKSPMSSKTTLPKTKNKKTDDFEDRILNIIETQETPREQNVINPHMSFFESILPSIKHFNEDETFDFRISVMNLIKSIKKRNVIGQSTPNPQPTNIYGTSCMSQNYQSEFHNTNLHSIPASPTVNLQNYIRSFQSAAASSDSTFISPVPSVSTSYSDYSEKTSEYNNN
ncbi:hypothetical protein QTP88_019247 [Uroleucon formosanum]